MWAKAWKALESISCPSKHHHNPSGIPPGPLSVSKTHADTSWRHNFSKNEREKPLTGLLGYTLEMWLFSLSTVQLRKQLMVWSSYFWLGALMTRVTGLSSAPESMAHITSRPGSEESVSQLRSHLRRACPQILSILDSATHLKQSLLWLGGGMWVPRYNISLICGWGRRLQLCW